MYVVIIVLTVIVAVLLIGIVLIQKSKGGGLSSQFGNAGSVMGVRQTNSFLEKTTWTLAGLIVVLSVASAYTMPKSGSETVIRSEAPASQPSAPGNQFETTPVVPTTPEAAAPAAEAPAAPAEAAEATE